METLIDYVLANGKITFDDKPLTLLDFALFNELGYLQLIEHLPNDWRKQDEICIHDLAPLFHESKQAIQFTFLNTKERIALFEAFLRAKRYRHVTISHYVNDVNTEFERQFAAVVFSIPELKTHQIVFRGTDDSLVGWKEDFKLTYMREIPAQRAAVVYLRTILPTLSGEVIVSGHSKGGNLAVYAAANMSEDMQNRLSLIYMLDAPGFRKMFLESSGYRRVSGKIVSIKPHESVVGVMLTSDKISLIVASKEKGMAQHLLLNWGIDRETDSFLGLEQLSPMSQKLEKTFAIWNQRLSHYELKHLFDLLFDLLIEEGVSSLDDLSGKHPLELRKHLEVYRQLTPQQRRLFVKAFNLFILAYRSSKLPKVKADKELLRLPEFFNRQK
ncbi:Mbeg1-like protein [Streptococcus pluranimalium]